MKFRYLMGLIPFLAMPVVASASDYGCEALLCFAGGKNVSECQPTIKRVLKDLAKGKGFPHCSMVSGSGGVSGSGDDKVSVRHYKQYFPFNQKYCQDGQTHPTKTFMRRSYCKTIEINIDPQYAADKEHQRQYFNY